MRLLIQLIIAGNLFLAQAQQPSQPTKPGPQHQKLQLWHGEWTYEGETYATVLGPGGKFTGKMTGRPTLNGFGLETVSLERGPLGETRNIESDGYDPVANNYPYISISDNGDVFQGVFTLNGTVAHWEGIAVMKGKRFQSRGTDAVSPDGMSISRRGEISADGKTWALFFTLQGTKVSPVPAEKAK
jgi:Protein of unknown function (DUF1579)